MTPVVLDLGDQLFMTYDVGKQKKIKAKVTKIKTSPSQQDVYIRCQITIPSVVVSVKIRHVLSSFILRGRISSECLAYD